MKVVSDLILSTRCVLWTFWVILSNLGSPNGLLKVNTHESKIEEWCFGCLLLNPRVRLWGARKHPQIMQILGWWVIGGCGSGDNTDITFPHLAPCGWNLVEWYGLKLHRWKNLPDSRTRLSEPNQPTHPLFCFDPPKIKILSLAQTMWQQCWLLTKLFSNNSKQWHLNEPFSFNRGIRLASLQACYESWVGIQKGFL